VGDGPDREWLHTLSQQLGIGEQCRWSGWHPNPWAVIEEASFLAFPSDFEGFGAVIVEAMAHGIPVLATDCDFGPRTVIQEGINGWLVPRDDTAFAQRLVQLVHGGIELPDPDLVQSTVRDQQRDQWAERLQAVCEAAIASRRRTTSRTRHVSS
jgi:UDP-D-galactose:(glucosyl)LPS alpha-1,6-D-galactosyltransferase